MVSILVFGTGNIGSVYACVLSNGGAQVTCVCRSNYEIAKVNGLKVVSPILGNLHARPTILQSISDVQGYSSATLSLTPLSSSTRPFDFVLVCTKATQETTSAAITAIKPAVMPGMTAVVLIQNGLGVERPFHEAFPNNTIISGVAYLPTTKVSAAVFSHSEVELLHIGLYPSSSMAAPLATQQINLFRSLIRAGGATAAVSKDIQVQRWIKVVANGAVNPICALSRCRDRELIELSPYSGQELFKEVMLEIANVAEAVGYGSVVDQTVVETQLARTLSRPYPGVQPSMMADALEMRTMEVEAVVGEVVKIAQDNHVKIPRLTTLHVLLNGLNHALQAAKHSPK